GYGDVPCASAPRQVGKDLAVRKFATGREEVEQRDLVESGSGLVRQPADEWGDPDTSADPHLLLSVRRSLKSTVRRVNVSVHANPGVTDQFLCVVAQAPDDEVDVAVGLASACDRERVRLAQAVLFHPDKGELAGYEPHRIHHGRHFQMQG